MPIIPIWGGSTRDCHLASNYYFFLPKIQYFSSLGWRNPATFMTCSSVNMCKSFVNNMLTSLCLRQLDCSPATA